MAYEEINGLLGYARIDRAAALISQTVFNMMRSSGKAANLKEFMPRWDVTETEERGSEHGDD